MHEKLFVSGWLALGAVFASPSLTLAAEKPQIVAGDIHRVGGEVTRPEKISGNPPVYNEMARKARLQGVVIVEAIIDEHGDVTNTRVLKGLPMGLDKATVDAVQSWKFKPSTFDGEPVKVFYTLTVNFQVSETARGPVFAEFLAGHAELKAALDGRRYADAEAILATLEPRPAEAEINLATVYVLFEQGRLREAWQRLEQDRGANPAPIQEDAAVALAQEALARSQREGEDAGGAVEMGLLASAEALSAAPNSLAARVARAQLLRRKAWLAGQDGQLDDEAKKLEEEVRQLIEASAGSKSRP